VVRSTKVLQPNTAADEAEPEEFRAAA
jgi:hypothetical protein